MTHKQKRYKSAQRKCLFNSDVSDKGEGFNHPDALVSWKAHIPGSLRDATMGMLFWKPPALLSFG